MVKKSQNSFLRARRYGFPLSLSAMNAKTLWVYSFRRWMTTPQTSRWSSVSDTAEKDFFSKCDQIHRKLQICSHLLKIYFMENYKFCVVRKTNFPIIHFMMYITSSQRFVIWQLTFCHIWSFPVWLILLLSYIFALRVVSSSLPREPSKFCFSNKHFTKNEVFH